MEERTAVLAGALAGAIVGAAASYLFLTERGRDLRDRLEPAVDDLRREIQRFQRTLEKVGDVASEGVRVIQELGEASVRR